MFIFLRVLSLLPERTKPADFDSSSVVEKNPDANRWSNSRVRFVIIDRSIFFGHSCWAGKVILAVKKSLVKKIRTNERKERKEKSLQWATCHVSLHYSNGCQWIVLYQWNFRGNAARCYPLWSTRNCRSGDDFVLDTEHFWSTFWLCYFTFITKSQFGHVHNWFSSGSFYVGLRVTFGDVHDICHFTWGRATIRSKSFAIIRH